MPVHDSAALLKHLLSQKRETEWLEFKKSNAKPDDLGEYISALANAAILSSKPSAYIVFGVADDTLEVVGTSVCLKKMTKGNEPIENWLSRSLEPRVNFEFVDFQYQGKHVEIIVISPAFERPVRFKKEGYIRVGSAKKPLVDHPEKETELWAVTSRYSFEDGIAASHLRAEDITRMFYCDEFLQLMGRSALPTDRLVAYLIEEALIIDDMQGGFNVTNLFALLTARNLPQFPALAGKAPRLIIYEDSDNLDAMHDFTGRRGYAFSFGKLLNYIMSLLPGKEVFEHGRRVKKYQFPEIAVRELLANALIHQDLTNQGSRPVISIYKNKLEITNPGEPLIPVDRFIDAPPKSRNAKLAGLMRRMNFCEERGSGVDRAVNAIEEQLLPPPLFKDVGGSTVVTLFAERSFANMTKEERIRAAYQHACLHYGTKYPMSNQSLRKRFGLNAKQYSQVSIVIREAIERGLILPQDDGQANRNARYIPAWAGG